MKKQKSRRYSFLIEPAIFTLDFLILAFSLYRFLGEKNLSHILIIGVFWFVLSYFVGYYRIYRYSPYNDLLTKSFYQLFIFDLALLAYHVFYPFPVSPAKILWGLLLLDIILILEKTFIFILLKKYRSSGYNIRNYVIFGYNNEIRSLKKLLDERTDYGYRFLGYFNGEDIPDDQKPEILGTCSDGLQYLQDNSSDIDVVFVSLNRFDDNQLIKLIDVCDKHFIQIKFIPDNKKIFKRKLLLEYFEYYPILSIQKSPLDEPFNAFIKRTFDIVFSLLVIIFILSWLTPILFVLIKLESKGPLFFKQRRNGENYREFVCLKFRSMRPNRDAHIKQVSKNDNRITRIGRILRKTSIDELPQFINVLRGDMSVVGPRPHMIKESERFRKQVDNFILRHYVKPGITGLAQVKGYRGEVVTDEDIKNRVKYDLYYIENWSLLLDIKIIIQTILNIFKGDKKAY